MAKNASLNRASQVKQDEFYTQIADIERELRHYTEHFRGKTIFCNCDDPETSNFWKYFELNFDRLGLKKLVATHYESDKPSYKLELIGDVDGDGRTDKHDIIKTRLVQNGDFRSPECIEILKESDIIITNPPFSLLREYIAQLFEYKKDFIIIASQNAIHYKEIFPLFTDNKMWLGYGFNGGNAYFAIPNGAEIYYNKSVYNPETGLVKFRNCCWFTNIDIEKRHEKLTLYKNYIKSDYPKYENYDAIEVSKISDIPCDYDGKMGVPDTILQYYNPEQFEIVGYGRGDFLPEIDTVPIEFLDKYRAIGGKGHITAGMKSLCYYDKNGKPLFPYSRIIIRRRNDNED